LLVGTLDGVSVQDFAVTPHEVGPFLRFFAQHVPDGLHDLSVSLEGVLLTPLGVVELEFGAAGIEVVVGHGLHRVLDLPQSLLASLQTVSNVLEVMH